MQCDHSLESFETLLWVLFNVSNVRLFVLFQRTVGCNSYDIYSEELTKTLTNTSNNQHK